jgi:hypothetical protein
MFWPFLAVQLIAVSEVAPLAEQPDKTVPGVTAADAVERVSA